MDARSELLKSMTAEQVEDAVADKVKSFHGLLTKEVALRLIAKEKGLLKEEERTYKIKEIPKAARKVSLEAKVEKVLPEIVFPSGKHCRPMLLKDESGEVKLNIWEKDIALLTKIRTGSRVAVRNAYEKFGELNLGYGGTVEVLEHAAFAPLNALPPAGRIHVRGLVSRVEGFSADGFAFFISGEGTEVRAVMREGADRGAKLEEGDAVMIEGAAVENNRLVLDSHSRLMVKKIKGVVSGKIDSLEEMNGGLLVRIGERELRFDRGNALRFLGLNAADDILLATIVGIKRGSLLNSSVALRVKEENGNFIIVK